MDAARLNARRREGGRDWWQHPSQSVQLSTLWVHLKLFRLEEQDVRELLSKASGGRLSSSALMQDLKEKLESAAPSVNELWEVLQQMSDGGRLNIRGDQLALA